MIKRWLSVLLLLIGLTGPALAGSDFFSTGPGQGTPDGLCDVWQAIYNGWGLDPAADTDKDGGSNYDECTSGTDPRQAGDCLRVKNGVSSAAKIVFNFKAKAGKIYRMVSDESAGGAFSTVVSQLAAADDANQTISVAKRAGKQKLYKLEVEDADSDNDGVSDWAEIKMGTDPRNPTTPTNASCGVVSDAVTLSSVLAVSAADAGIEHLLQHSQAAAHASAKSKLYKRIIVYLAKAGKLPSCSSGISRGDFNGDGFADLAVGIPSEDAPAGTSGSGAVVVIYGSANGLTATTAGIPAPQFWSQNTDGISGASESGDRFGTALASGEFNGDAFSDLAIGVPGEDITVGTTAHPNTGRVVIIYGSSVGLAASGTNMVHASQSFDLTSGTMPAVITYRISSEIFPDNASVGQSLAWGDFNGDTIGDLAIGAPNMAVKNDFALFADSEAGQVWILFGSLNNGLTRSGSQILTQSGNLPLFGLGSVRRGWHNGASLVGGDFNGDGVSDLVIGAPDASTGGKNGNGLLTVFPGVAGEGLDWGGGNIVGSGSVGVVSQTGDHFGVSFAAGDFDHDGFDDLAIGTPDLPGRRTVNSNGSVTDRDLAAGAVHVLFGHPTTILTNSGFQSLDQNVLFGSGREAGDRFGFSLAAGDFNGDTIADLAIGVPLEDLAGGNDAGEVNVIFGSSNGLSATKTPAPQRLGDTSAQAGAQFGRVLSAWNFGRNQKVVIPFINLIVTIRTADLAVGVPFKDISGAADAGAMHVFYGTTSGLTFTGEQEWTQDSPGIPGGSEAGDLFGSAGY